MKRFGIRQCDCIEVMKSMKNDSVDFTLTDIPYNKVNRQSIGFYFRKL